MQKRDKKAAKKVLYKHINSGIERINYQLKYGKSGVIPEEILKDDLLLSHRASRLRSASHAIPSSELLEHTHDIHLLHNSKKANFDK